MQPTNKAIVSSAKKAIREKPEIFEALLEFERTKKLPKINYKERANFTLDAKLLKRFREYCKKQGYNMSAKVEKAIRQEMGEH